MEVLLNCFLDEWTINKNKQMNNKLIEKFAETAKIPVIGGIFKAAIGNLVITAVLSNFVGSRFIITKHSPYSILEKQKLPPS